ncbi:dynein associated protein-domain-containing protein [Phaeosphaeriaceae sp. PMI808]|nr:dynein associated protein-domain-containing protein [Phaeosphaeriaceae sp. PMI808]
MSQFKIGQTVETSAHQQGTVKYVGPIHVAEGDWLGIDLQSPIGKNDGSVRGERYFTCPPLHGLFIKESNILRVVAQAAPRAAPAPKSTTAAPKVKARPSSVIAPKSAPRASLVISKRQSVAAPSSSSSTFRAPARKASIAGTTPSTSSAPSTLTKATRDSNVGTLETKVRHLEKQHTEDQERLKELSHAKDERDRFHGIIQKLQTKCQTLHQESIETKAQLQQLESDNDRLSKAAEEYEADFEIALLDKEMAEERAEQAEAELDTLRAKLEERDMELEILHEEAELFTTDMSAEEKEEAGYYRLQHENDRLRQALIALKEMTEETERDSKARISELEADTSLLEQVREEKIELQEKFEQNRDAILHMQAQVDAGAEWEEVSNEMTMKNQELEDRISTQDAVIRDLESLRELNDELELQHIEQEEELRLELETKDIELTEQYRRMETQENMIAEHQTLISKFRDLVFELQGKMADAETSRNMTEAQVKDTTGRFNEVMDLNRRLRASNVQATSKEITSELRKLHGEEVSEKLAILTETESIDFVNSEPLRAYFAAKRISAKASLAASLLASTDRQLSYDGGLDEALNRLQCAKAIQHLAIIRSGSDRLWSAMVVAPLPQFANFGQAHEELVVVESVLNVGLEGLQLDEVNFRELVGSFGRSNQIQGGALIAQQDALAALPEDETLARIQNIMANLDYLSSNFAVVNTMLSFIANNAKDLFADKEPTSVSSDAVIEKATEALERFVGPTVLFNKAMVAGQKLLKTIKALRKDSLYPHILGVLDDIIDEEEYLTKMSSEAAEWGQNAINLVVSTFQQDATLTLLDVNLDDMLFFYFSEEVCRLEFTATHLNTWNDNASILLNSTEISHGPTPWSQKAKEVEASRKKNSEASVLLEDLKSEHKTVLLSLLERERVIETKSLEIEHLGAKYRDAANKVDASQRLRDKVAKAEYEADELRGQVEILVLKIKSLEEHAASKDRSDHAPTVPDTASTAMEPVEQPSVSRSVPAALKVLLNAQQDENHWLRHRENTDLYKRNLRDMAIKKQDTYRWECFLLGKLEDAWMVSDYDYVSDDSSDSDDELSSEPPAKPMKQTMSIVEPRTPQPTEERLKRSPLAIVSANSSWQPSFDSDEGIWADMESHYLWKDLSDVEEEEEDEEGDTAVLEGFSELHY